MMQKDIAVTEVGVPKHWSRCTGVMRKRYSRKTDVALLSPLASHTTERGVSVVCLNVLLRELSVFAIDMITYQSVREIVEWHTLMNGIFTTKTIR